MNTRIKWTESEQDTLYTAALSLLKDKPKLKVHEAVSLSQVTIPESRRRKHLVGASQLPVYLRERFIVAGVLSKDWKKAGRRRGPELVPIERVAEVELHMQRMQEERAEAERRIAVAGEERGALESQVRELAGRIKEMENRPSFFEALRDYVADILAESIRRSRAVPGGIKDSQASEVLEHLFKGTAPRRTPNPPQIQHPTEMEPEKAHEQKNIVVVGVKLDEEVRYQKHFAGRARVRYWKDNKVHSLEELARHADIVFINRSATGDPVVNVAKRTAKLLQEVPTSGDRLRDAIDHYIEHPDSYSQGGLSAAHN